ncbi:hypothetical protein Q8F55_008800 [Vanrija albida]|uniref:Glycosyltransferase family 32 protein n=1 Tax=Vanrija albida TaxID=181172 RepID=A0ABR3PRT2_9TREE
MSPQPRWHIDTNLGSGSPSDDRAHSPNFAGRPSSTQPASPTSPSSSVSMQGDHLHIPLRRKVSNSFQSFPAYSDRAGRQNGGSGSNSGTSSAERVSFLPVHERGRLEPSPEPLWSTSGVNLRMFFRRKVLLRLGMVLGAILLGIWWLIATFEFQIEAWSYRKSWIKAELASVRPLKGCWKPENISPEYNMTKHMAGRKHMLATALGLKRGLACYDYASTIQQRSDEPLNDLIYHSYWRSDLIPWGDRQTANIIAWLATQPLDYSKLIIWSNGAEHLRANDQINTLIQDFPDNVEVRQADVLKMAEGTEILGMLKQIMLEVGGLYDKRAWVDGDAVRLLALWHYGGLWLDMDMILTRDLHPLTESEFLIQWDCFDKPDLQMNGAIMHFEKHSPYLCETFHIMATGEAPTPNSFSWGSLLYSRLHQRHIAEGREPFAVLPWCFTDPRNCRNDNRFPDPFYPDPSRLWGVSYATRDSSAPSGRELHEKALKDIFAIHLHNQWLKDFPKGNYVDRLISGFRADVERLKRKPARRAVRY